MREYLGADRIEGPLLIVEGVGDAAYGELVEVVAADGVRFGQVLATGERQAVIELWGDTAGLRTDGVRVRFRGESLHVGVAREMLGRVFDGVGRPRDDLPPVVAEERLDAHGSPLNPTARAYPQEVIRTGISAIDGLNTLVRGQKLPIFSGSGLPHNQLAAQIAIQARLAETIAGEGAGAEADETGGTGFAVIFVALGAPHDTAAFFQEQFEESGLLSRTALFLNLADDPPMERIITPRVALTLAEFLAFRHDTHVLVLLTDMANYAEALRELSARRNEVPGRKGYPGYLYTDLATLYERCGRIRGTGGSVTQIPILTMPGDDITHPIPDLTGYITEGQIVLSRALHREGIYPPIDVLPSLSRLMKEGIGAERTRADHPNLATQLYAAYARAQEIRALAIIIGENALSETDRSYLKLAQAFEQRLLTQGSEESRTIHETLELGWETLSVLPAEELTRVSEEELAQHYRGLGARDPARQGTDEAEPAALETPLGTDLKGAEEADRD